MRIKKFLVYTHVKMIIMPPEYITKEEYEKREAEIREEIFKLRKQIQKQIVREEERWRIDCGLNASYT